MLVLGTERRNTQMKNDSVQLLSCVQLFETPWTAACQASLPFTNSRSLLKLISIESVMPSNHLILSSPSPPPLIFLSIRVFSKESVLHIRWPKYWSFSFSFRPFSEYDQCETESHSVVSNFLQPRGLYSPWNSLGQNTGVGILSLLQGIFPTQGSNSGLLHCRQILYQLSQSGLTF